MRIDDQESVGLGAALLFSLFSLSDRQRYIVVQRHIRGRSLSSIADELGLTKQGVSVAEQTALSLLRKRLRYCAEAFAE